MAIKPGYECAWCGLWVELHKKCHGCFPTNRKLRGKQMDASEYAQSGMDDWLKATELKGKAITVKIESVEVCTFGSDDPKEHKLGLRFEGKEKGIIANKTNTKNLIEAFGAETDKWIGKEIIARPNDTPLGVGFSLQPNVDFDDDIPF